MNTLFSNRALFFRVFVCRSSILIASFDGVVLVSFVAQARSIMFYDFWVPGACCGDSFVLNRKSGNFCVKNISCEIFSVNIFS